MRYLDTDLIKPLPNIKCNGLPLLSITDFAMAMCVIAIVEVADVDIFKNWEWKNMKME